MNNDNNTGCAYCSNHFRRHCQINLQLVECLKDQLKKAHNENARLTAKVAELTGMLKTSNAVESPTDVENNVEDWEVSGSAINDNCYEDDVAAEGSSSASVNVEESYSQQQSIKHKSVTNSTTDNNFLADNEDTNDKVYDDVETKNVIPEEEAREIFAAAKLKWDDASDPVLMDDSSGNSGKKLYSTVGFHKKFVSSDENAFFPEEKPEVAVSYSLPQWSRDETVCNNGNNTNSDKQNKAKEEEECKTRAKRHCKHEVEEQKRKRWDSQRVREEKYIEKLKQNQYKKRTSQSLISFLPTSFETTAISIGDCCVPIDAFGLALPRHTMTEYHCDRIPPLDEQ